MATSSADVTADGVTTSAATSTTTTTTTTPPSPGAAAAAAAPAKPSGQFMVYVVQPGEWLSFIARKHDVSLQDLLDSNPDLDPDDVYDGQEIIIPLDKDEGGQRWEASEEEEGRTSAADRTDDGSFEEGNKWQKQVDVENQKKSGGASCEDGESKVLAMAAAPTEEETETYKKRKEEEGPLGAAVVLRDSSAERDSNANGKEGERVKEEGEEEEEEEEEEEQEEYYDHRQDEEEKAMEETSDVYGDVEGDSHEDGHRSGRRLVGAPQPSMLPTEVYTIKPGDRLKLIARRRGIDMRDLKLLNPGLDVTDVRVGESVLLPQVGVYQRRPASGLQLAVASACMVLMAGSTVWALVSLIRALLGKVNPRREVERDPELGILIPKGLELQEGPSDLHQPESTGEKAGSRSGGKVELGTVEIQGSFAFWPWLLAHQWLRRDFARFQALADEIELTAADAGKRIQQLLRAWFYIDKVILFQHTYVETVFLFPGVLGAVRQVGDPFAEDAITELMRQHGSIERKKEDVGRLVLHLKNYSLVQQTGDPREYLHSWQMILNGVREDWQDFVTTYEQLMVDEEATLIPLVVRHVSANEQEQIANNMKRYVSALDTGHFEVLQLRDVARQCGQHSWKAFTKTYSWAVRWFFINWWERTDPYYLEHRDIFYNISDGQ